MRKYLIHLVLALALVATYAVAQAGQNQPAAPGQSDQQQPAAGAAQESGAQQANPSQQNQDQDRDKQAEKDKDKGRAKNNKEEKAESKSDEALERQVRDQLASNPEFQNVKVEVKNSVAILSGSVPKAEDRKEAAQRAKSVAGIKRVREHLSISAAGAAGSAAASSQTSSENTAGSIAGNAGAQAGTQAGAASSQTTVQVQNQIQQTIRQEPALAASNVNVNVVNNQIVLTGTVPNEEAKRKAEQVAQSQAGGLQVINNINVSSSAAAGAAGTTGGTTGAATGEAQPPAAGAQAGTGEAVGSQAGAQSQGAAGATAGAAGNRLQTQIQNAFQQEPTLSSCNLTSNVTDDSIQLAGTCPTGKEKQTAVRIAQSFAGNRRVVDRITVTGRGREERPEQQQVPPQSPPPQL